MSQKPAVAVATIIALAVDADGPLVGIAFLGEPGSGKTAAATALIESCPFQRTAMVADDGAVIDERDGHLYASPHPRISGQAEARGAGLFQLKNIPEIRLSTAFLCVSGPTRLPDEDYWQPMGEGSVRIPLVPLPPLSTVRLYLRSVLSGHSVRGRVD